MQNSVTPQFYLLQFKPEALLLWSCELQFEPGDIANTGVEFLFSFKSRCYYLHLNFSSDPVTNYRF